jgi:hypothetical protein
MRCVLDLGIQKTASKCRQRFFAAEGRRIVGRRFCYPAAGRNGAWHRPLYDALRRGDHGPLRAAAAEAEALGADLVILSYEELHKLDTPAIARLADSFPELHAVVFLRRQDDFVNSFHNQLHKAHRVPFADLLAFEAAIGDDDPHLDYDRMLERWGSVLGPRRVHPLCYDKRVSPVAAFFGAVDIAPDLAGYVEPRPNPAIDAVGLAVLRALKRAVGDAPDLLAVMREAHRMLAPHFVAADGAEPDTLGPTLRARIMALYRDGNDRVRRRFFPGQAELFPPSARAEGIIGLALDSDASSPGELAEAILAAVRRSGQS